ncbi:NAD(P)-dependent oxidoreductase [Methanobrevibacter sp.]|uniref:NAD-dependent epimerase/dehydratase family protein n=1 Tax=Methanobrevibacter sp. TaxID=66852 RepID=UPI0026DF1315|nr:NAD(P)-dependent oxidoreductase [Methanobrevibacter sp.]MDO5860824.1 NAD(P)-dependent oxidoreductase [Methanobrevibacter sp.]
MSKYIILTGGTGFVGSHILEELLKLNKKVILLKRSFSNTWRISEFIENENLVIRDIDKENLNDIFNQYTVNGIFHLASISKREIDLEIISNMVDSNITFPTKLLETAINHDVKFFINTGSVYEYQLDQPPISEKTNIKPFNLYASTKIAFEDILKFYSDNFQFNCSTLKLFTPYGPKDNENKITPYLITNSIKKENIFIKSPNKTLDLIYVKDVVDGYINLMNNISKFEEYETFNMGTGIGTSIKDVLKIIEKNLGKNDNVDFGNLEDNQVWCSNNKIKEKLNWSPKINLDEGIKLTVDYYKKKYATK